MNGLSEEELKKKWQLPNNQLIVVYDNKEPADSIKNLDLLKGWGFSAAIKFNGKSILFDCGWSGRVLLHNLKELNITVDKFDYIIISHKHWDHTGGLSRILDENPEAIVILPDDFSNNLTRELKIRSKDVIRVKGSQGVKEILPNFFVTGDLHYKGSVGEQSAFLKGDKFNLLIVGCMHPGLKPIYNQITKNIEIGKPNALIGGVHGFKDVKYLESTSIRHLFLGHCTEHPETFQNIQSIEYKGIYTGFYLEL